MKLLLINYEFPPFGGGGGNSTKEIGEALAKMGHQVSVLTTNLGCMSGDNNCLQFIRIGARRKHKYSVSKLEILSFVVRGMIWAYRQKENKWDGAIVFFLLPSGLIAAALKRRFDLPYIVSLRGADVPGFEPSITIVHRLLTSVRRRIFRGAQKIVANSPTLVELSSRVDSFPITVIPNGVDTTRYCPAISYATNDGNRPLKIILVCRFSKQKSVPNTVQLLAGVIDAGIPVTVTIIGDGPDNKLVYEVVRNAKMEKIVNLPGWLDKDELLEEYRVADCFMSLSKWEGMPNVVLEAMACGLPVILSDISAHRDLITNMVEGFLVSGRDLGEITNAIRQISDNKLLRKSMGSKGRQRVIEKHNWTEIAKKYCQHFDF